MWACPFALPNMDQEADRTKTLGSVFAKPTGGESVKVTAIRNQHGEDAQVVACGGDGTVMWLLELLLEVGADLSRIGVGVMPFGTGNDLARCLGFGGTPPRPLFGEALLSLRSHVERYLHAHAVLFDVWEVTVSLSPEGRVTVVEQSAGQGHKKDVTPHGLKLIKRMNNYCSVGLDAYVGHSFDKRRTSSQTGNKVVYGLEGIRRMLVPPPPVSSYIDCVRRTRARAGEEDTNEVLFYGEGPGEETRFPTLTGDPQSLTVLNISSYMGEPTPTLARQRCRWV